MSLSTVRITIMEIVGILVLRNIRKKLTTVRVYLPTGSTTFESPPIVLKSSGTTQRSGDFESSRHLCFNKTIKGNIMSMFHP